MGGLGFGCTSGTDDEAVAILGLLGDVETGEEDNGRKAEYCDSLLFSPSKRAIGWPNDSVLALRGALLGPLNLELMRLSNALRFFANKGGPCWFAGASLS